MQEQQDSILIVDDTPANLHLLIEVLKKHELEVRIAPSGKLALKAIAQHPPALILLDINMPEMNGYEVCEAIKAQEALAAIPIIFISAADEYLDKVKAFKMGAVDYVTKPFQPEEVIERVETHLKLRRTQRDLQESFKKLKALEQHRDSLVHMIVHDMRSPLTALISSLEILGIDGDLKEQSLEDLEIALLASRRINQMTSEMLDLSRLETETMPIDAKAEDISKLVRDVADQFPALSEVTIADGLHSHCDSRLTRRVLENLLTNRFKHCGGAQVRINLQENSGFVTFEVSDEGPHLPKEELKNLFDKFSNLRDNHGPGGISLAFCRLAIEAQSGEMHVASRQDETTTFSFTLPVCPPG